MEIEYRKAQTTDNTVTPKTKSADLSNPKNRDVEAANEESSTCCDNLSCGGYFDTLKQFFSWNSDFWDERYSSSDFRVTIWVSIFSLIVSIVIIATVASSYWYVQYHQYAIEVNTYNGPKYSKTYTEGRYFLTLDKKFTYFPSTFQYVNFVSDTFADNGLEYELYIRFFYELPEENIGDIYNRFSNNYDSRVVNNAKQLVKNVASEFSVDDYQNNRTYIENVLGDELEIHLMNTVEVNAPSEYFEITTIVYPQTLTDASLQSAVTLQENQQKLAQQNVDVVYAETDKLKSEIDATTEKTREFAINEAQEIIENAESEALNKQLTARSNGIDILCDTLGITNTSQKTEIVNIFSVFDNENDVTMFNNVNNGLLINTN
jgi:hypothetical protein